MLTRQQQRILDYLQREAAAGNSPTRQEIAAAFGFRSPNAAEEHLRALARKGEIEILPGQARGIRLRRGAGLPVIGRVAAGAPLLAVENIERELSIDPGLFRPRPDYALRVHGDSMRDAGIVDGDLVLVHKTERAASQSIVVARLDDDVTVKRLDLGATTRLLPANDAYAPIVVSHTVVFAIEGVVVGVLRGVAAS
jgi:repressor LexA